MRLDMSPSAVRRAHASWFLSLGYTLPCTCLFGYPTTEGCPTHDPENCPGIDAIRDAARRRHLVGLVTSQVAELVDADCCGGEDEAGGLRVVLLEPPRANAHIVGTEVALKRRDPLGYLEPVATAAVSLAGGLA